MERRDDLARVHASRLIGNQLKSEKYRNGILLDFSIEKLRIHGNRAFSKIRPLGETVNCFFSFC